MGNGTIIKQLPLINIIGFVSNAVVFVLKVVECSNHMSDGRKNMPHILKANYSLTY